mmetsp:Transcript_35200/g.107875  ORF Transcript_35200/g.107875 Transcript_35200/m.107875 type:complete len:250 (-) Transcript_35200:256-1005(-)
MCGSRRGRAARRGSQRLSRRWRRPASRFPQRSVCPRHAGASWVRVFERRRWPGVSGVGEFEFFMFAHAFAFWSVALHTSRHTYNRRYTHTHTLLTLQTTHIYGSHGEPLAPVEGVPAAPRREHSRRAQRRGERAQREHKPNSNTNSRHSAQLSQIEARLHAVNYGAIASSSDCVWMCSGGSPPHGPAELTLQSSASVGVTPPPRRRAMRMVTSPMAARRIRFAAFSSETATPLITSIRSPNLSRAEASP